MRDADTLPERSHEGQVPTHDLPHHPRRVLEDGAPAADMVARLLRAAHRLSNQDAGSWREAHALRSEQAQVFADFSDFLIDLATRPGGGVAPYGRVILPPRTGKTVIAGHIISRCDLSTTFLVPTRALVEQTARELSAQLPGIAVGIYSGERKDLVSHGVNVATYQILQRDLGVGAIPPQIAGAALIFADEAHHAMTEDRMALLQGGFHPGAVRVALTATPDYDERRVLCRHFPVLIHELTLDAAVELRLLAPLRVWVVEVDADASQVRLLAGDYDEVTLGRVMSAAPFARSVQVFRYHPENRHRPALIACASRQQAQDLRAYLSVHRPADTPPPALILGETQSAARELGLALFERGDIDTLIQVGVLVEGWNSPRCKLLIDLAPSISRVRATQKYCRVMTRRGDEEARIYVILPASIPGMPILPNELFGASQQHYECGELVGQEPQRRRSDPCAADPFDGAIIEGVTLKKRILHQARFSRPLLRRDRPRDIARVLRTCSAFDPANPVGLYAFRQCWFQHALFTGRGEFLLRWLGVPQTRAGYLGLLARVFPDALGTFLLAAEGLRDPPWCREDRRVILRALRQGAGAPAESEVFRQCWRAVCGHSLDAGAGSPEGPEAQLLRREERRLITYALRTLGTRRRMIVVFRYGLLGARACSMAAIAEGEKVSPNRIWVLAQVGLRHLRRVLRQGEDGLCLRDPLRAGAVPLPSPRRADPPPSIDAKTAKEAARLGWPFWEDLPRPISPRQMLPLVGALLSRLGRRPDVAQARPTLNTWVEEGVPQGEARWQAGDEVIELLRHGHAAVLHEGGEEVVEGLRVCVSGLPGGTKLLLAGPLGQLCRFAVVGGREAAVVRAAWRGALSSSTT